jgi:hypothetical protein
MLLHIYMCILSPSTCWATDHHIMQMNIIDNCEGYYKKDMVGCKEVSNNLFWGNI